MNVSTTPKPDDATGLKVFVTGPGGWTASRALQANDTVTVGSKAGCGMRLQGQSASPIHCILKTVDGVLFVQDWCSSGGTYVDGSAISDTTEVAFDAEIRVGDFRISCREPKGTAVRENPLLPGPPEPGSVADDVLPAPDSWWGNGRAADALPGESGLDEFESPQEPWGGSRSVEQETIDLLKYEIESLQHEIAERDHRIAELDRRSVPEEGVEGFSDESSVELAKLATRLEELLDELDRSDTRIAELQEALRCSEEAAQAEREERRQLDAWVVDIERRIGERENEWQAERSELQQRLQNLATRGESLPQNPPSGGSPADTRELESLRQENQSLQAQLEQLRQEQVTRLTAPEPPAETPVPSSLREEQIQIARDRAALARQQAEVANARAELQRLAETRQREESVGDARLRAFRDHLREIHIQEQQQKPAELSLGARIAQIWHRLEGR